MMTLNAGSRRNWNVWSPDSTKHYQSQNITYFGRIIYEENMLFVNKQVNLHQINQKKNILKLFKNNLIKINNSCHQNYNIYYFGLSERKVMTSVNFFSMN